MQHATWLLVTVSQPQHVKSVSVRGTLAGGCCVLEATTARDRVPTAQQTAHVGWSTTWTRWTSQSRVLAQTTRRGGQRAGCLWTASCLWWGCAQEKLPQAKTCRGALLPPWTHTCLPNLAHPQRTRPASVVCPPGGCTAGGVGRRRAAKRRHGPGRWMAALWWQTAA